MTALIQAVPLVKPLDSGSVAPSQSGPSGSFKALFEEAVDRVERYRATADNLTKAFLSGEDQDLHTVALATQQSELAFETFLQLRNKVVQAYQEIMRMQL